MLDRRALLRLSLGAGCLAATGTAQAEKSAPTGLYSLSAQPLRDAPALSDFQGKPAIAILFQPHCPFCLLQFREAQEFGAARPDLNVFALSLRGRTRDLLAEIRRAKANVPAFKSSPELIEALGRPEGTPRVYAIDANGKVTAYAKGLQKQPALTKLAKTTSA